VFVLTPGTCPFGVEYLCTVFIYLILLISGVVWRHSVAGNYRGTWVINQRFAFDFCLTAEGERSVRIHLVYASVKVLAMGAGRTTVASGLMG
jgi:hypothetical protein